ncbi:efflux RND transporter periplasmic adaptor subunit [Aliidiomarina soli]|uniref:Efflux transporter periplasmic adaptor subunit n=1 Tax=Aliidiomarina soli TaxID=1928574 RepID=A0A432WHE9_9GAMM|nr:efflux RND transporter periplasmic adaptor subunit [Aliidiomarina soli]RUO33204.1 efflux transporter periplasmic adaptor subunit [Aliidiomarina soli]
MDYSKFRYALVFCFTVSWLFSSTVVAQSDEQALVVTETLRLEQQTQRVEAVGTAQALRSVILYPAVADRVTEVNIVAGSRVSKGDVLVQMDARRQQVALDRARIQLADAERTVDRLTRSREQQAIPQSELDDAVTVRDLLQVQLTEAETEFEDRKVRAPFDGVVGITDVEIGDRINEQTAITTLDHRDQLYIDFRAPESALELLQREAVLRVSPWQQQGTEIEARVAQIDSRLDSENRTIRIRALIDNANDRYRPGTSFRVSLQTEGESYASIPEAALMWGPTSPYVWRVTDGRAERVDVQIKQRTRSRVLVDGDLEQGQTLITEGVQNVREGQAVRSQTMDNDA